MLLERGRASVDACLTHHVLARLKEASSPTLFWFGFNLDSSLTGPTASCPLLAVAFAH